ncbi:hypothetical protein TB2_037814 [Malus domestica]
MGLAYVHSGFWPIYHVCSPPPPPKKKPSSSQRNYHLSKVSCSRVEFDMLLVQLQMLEPILTQSFGISTHGFNLTSKIFDDDQSERYEQGIVDFEVPSSMFVPLTMAAVVNLAASIWGLVEIFRGSNNLDGLFVQMFIAGFGIVNNIPIYEALILGPIRENFQQKLP